MDVTVKPTPRYVIDLSRDEAGMLYAFLEFAVFTTEQPGADGRIMAFTDALIASLDDAIEREN